MTKGKSKGSSNERSQCRDWSLWWSEGLDLDPLRDDIFYRTASSGGRGRVRAKQGKATYGGYGDMQAADPIGDPLIKCCTFEFKKGYKELSLFDLVDSKQKNPIFKVFLEQVSNDAFDAGNEPALIIHRDRRKPVIVMRKELFNDMSQFYGRFQTEVITFTAAHPWGHGNVWFLFPLEGFFRWANPQYFIDRAGVG